MNNQWDIPKQCDLETFTNAVINALIARFPEHTIKAQRQAKNNGTFLSGIIISSDDKAVAPEIYVDSFYKRFLKEGCFNKLVDEIAECFSQALLTPDIDVSTLVGNTEEVRRNIIFKLVNAEKNKELLKGVPHRLFKDLAVIYCRYLEVNNSLGSIMLTHELARSIGADEDELFSLAVRNTPSIFPLTVHSMAEMMARLMGIGIEELPEEMRYPSSFPMTVFTNARYSNGAGCLLYPEFSRIVREHFDTDVYILPSSIHELLAVPADRGPEGLLDIVHEVNNTQVERQDFLSDNIYLFRFNTGDIELVKNVTEFAGK